MKARRLVLFDLDGTLIDSETGITASITWAFAQIGVEAPPREVLRGWIGPPFWHTFPGVLGEDEARIEAAIGHYRVRFDEVGWSEHAVYPGVPALLAALAAGGARLAIVTGKVLPQARRIIEHSFGGVFEGLYAPDAGHRDGSKAALVARALADAGIDAADAAMVGDRHFDVAGARANGVHALGVTWGFGSREELLEAGADAIADAPSQLHALLGHPRTQAGAGGT
jgi:phosphoglycolate phosphatase